MSINKQEYAIRYCISINNDSVDITLWDQEDKIMSSFDYNWAFDIDESILCKRDKKLFDFIFYYITLKQAK